MTTGNTLPTVVEGDFYEGINKAIEEKRHVTYLKKVIKDFEKYKEVFSQVFTLENPKDVIYKFRFNYVHKHPVWRDIAILGSQTLCEMAEALIESMNWDNDHMHGFSLKKLNNVPLFRYNEFSIYAPGWEDDPHPTFKTDEIKVADIDWQKYPKWNFVFDFGDSHEFDVELRTSKAKPVDKNNTRYLPMCIDQRGVAPIQYPDGDESPEWEFSEDCPHCQELKKSKNKLYWFTD